MPSALIRPDLYRRAALAIYPDETRYYINGVRVEPHPDGGTLLIATNGHVLIAIRDIWGWCDGPMTVNLDRPMAKAAAKKLHLKSRIIVTDDRAALIEPPGPEAEWPEDAEAVALDCLDQMAQFGERLAAFQFRDAWVGGDFVDWRAVVPKQMDMGPMEETPKLNASYVGLMGQIFSDGNGSSVNLCPSPDGGPILVVPDNDPRFQVIDGYGLIMPVRYHRTVGVADWFSASTGGDHG